MKPLSPSTTLLLGALMLGVMMSALASAGQPWVCLCGTVRVWYSGLNGPETSQQMLDVYSFTHISHGLIFAMVLGALKPTNTLPQTPRWATPMLAAMALEGFWEILENSPFIIARYRATAIGAGYFGDSILNSTMDMACMLLGFALAYRMGPRIALALLLVSELTLMLTVRDSLLLSAWGIFGLPPAVQNWQAASPWA